MAWTIILVTSLSVRRVGHEVAGELRFPAVAVLEQLVLVVEKLLASFGGELEIRALDDRVDRAGLLAEAAIDALGHVDVVAGRSSAAVVARLGLDRDRERRADRLAQFARDAPLLADRIAAQRVLATKARAQHALLVGVVERRLGLEHVAEGQPQARQQLRQEQASGTSIEKRHGWLSTPKILIPRRPALLFGPPSRLVTSRASRPGAPAACRTPPARPPSPPPRPATAEGT